MAQMTHRILFITLFTVGAIAFVFVFFYQIFPVLEGIVRWTAPLGIGLLVIGGTGMIVTSKRQMKKRLKQMDASIDRDDLQDGEAAHVGVRFADYLTSPEQATTVYMFFMVGVIMVIWSMFLLVNWIRNI